jgi:hypothetical protein
MIILKLMVLIEVELCLVIGFFVYKTSVLSNVVCWSYPMWLRNY